VARQIDTHASETAFIELGSPWQNAYVESFNGRVRDELLDIEEFSCLADARVVIVPAASAHHAALNTRPGVARSRPMAPTPDAARAPRRVRAAGPLAQTGIQLSLQVGVELVAVQTRTVFDLDP
jgi:Integrase core domain